MPDWIRVRDLDTGHALTVDSSQIDHGRFERLTDTPAVNELGDPLAPEHGAYPVEIAPVEEGGQGEASYEASTIAQLDEEIERRNADRDPEGEGYIVPDPPRNKQQLIDALKADDSSSSS
jgi:hypothetical protein